MSRLMPGRVRNQGIKLYLDGKVELIDSSDNLFQFVVDELEFRYDINNTKTQCQCDLFANKGYCDHLAAVEYFFKNSQTKEATVYRTEEVVKQKRQDHQFASRFLDELEGLDATAIKYQLSAYGELSHYTNQLVWTLKIKRLPDSRVYVVRDITYLLRVIHYEDEYQIGKNYFEPLSLPQFDPASRDLITFLSRLATSDSQVFFPDYGRHLFLPEGFFEEGLALLRALSQFELILGVAPMAHEAFVAPLTAEQGFYQFKVKLETDSITLLITETTHLTFFDHRYIYDNQVFYRLDTQQQRLVKAIQSLPINMKWQRYLSFDPSDQGKLAQHLLDFAKLGVVTAPKSFDTQDFTPSFFLDRQGDRLLLNTSLDYGRQKVNTAEVFEQLPFTSNHKKLTRVEHQLQALGFHSLFESSRTLPSGAELYEFLEHELPQLSQLGEVTLSPAVQNLRHLERPSIYLERSGGLLEVNFDFSGLVPEDIEQALTSLRKQDPYFISRSGQVILFDDEVKRISETLVTLRAKQVGTQGYQLSSLASFQVKDSLADYDRATLSEELEQMTAHLAAPETFDLPTLPVTAGLRDYQKRGVQWLSVLDHYGFGGILADDMGLGKTLQTIAFLSPKLAEGKTALIVTPSSLIYNWQEEFAKFYPEADVCVVQGNKSQRDAFIAEQHQVSLTSYHSFRQDLDRYQSQHYDYLILDEAQALKNSQTKIAQALREFDVARCYALSGTPIENRLLEIWSIFQIVLPGLFDSKAQFNRLSAKEVAKIIQPFVLRRKKEDVLPELPEVTEITYHNEMSKDQKAVYLAQLERMKSRLSHVTESEFSRHKIEILSGITRLRQICDTPQLFMPFDGSSGKMDSLRDLLLQIKENGHRALIFSQFKTMLTLVESELSQLGLESYLLTGSTNPKDRQAMTTAFNKGSRDAFLMSLKAGGVGLNLTGADTVILIDLWWNPAVEMQAIGRAHRLGQEKPVQVYRLITQGSIEEKILTMQEDKRHLMTDVLEGTDTRSSLSLEDIKQILGMTED